jgi:hypothetical protein
MLLRRQGFGSPYELVSTLRVVARALDSLQFFVSDLRTMLGRMKFTVVLLFCFGCDAWRATIRHSNFDSSSRQTCLAARNREASQVHLRRVGKCLAMSANDAEKKLDTFLEWAASRKIFPHHIKVGVENGRRGVFATEDIDKGETILEVPDWLFSYFSTSSVSGLPDGWETDYDPENGRPFFVNRAQSTLTLNKPVPDLQYFQDRTSPIAGISREMWDTFPWQWTLALRLMAELERGESSPIVPYLSVLPSEYTTSLWRFSDKELAEMQVRGSLCHLADRFCCFM